MANVPRTCAAMILLLGSNRTRLPARLAPAVSAPDRYAARPGLAGGTPPVLAAVGTSDVNASGSGVNASRDAFRDTSTAGLDISLDAFTPDPLAFTPEVPVATSLDAFTPDPLAFTFTPEVPASAAAQRGRLVAPGQCASGGPSTRTTDASWSDCSA